MKLLFCPKCQDVIRLMTSHRTCHCGEIGGHYIDNLNAVYNGNAIPLGIHNTDFWESLQYYKNTQNHEKLKLNFRAFIITPECSTFRKLDG